LKFESEGIDIAQSANENSMRNMFELIFINAHGFNSVHSYSRDGAVMNERAATFLDASANCARLGLNLYPLFISWQKLGEGEFIGNTSKFAVDAKHGFMIIYQTKHSACDGGRRVCRLE
jgi:hypothetical protein